MTMDNPLKLGVTILALVIGGTIAWKILSGLVGWLFSVALTIGVVAAIGLILYGLVFRKAIGGGGSGRLP